MFFVYYGYVGPDNYDASEGPIYKLAKCETEEEVIDLKKGFDSIVNEGNVSNPIFRVFEGEELELVPKKVVVDYTIKSGDHYV